MRSGTLFTSDERSKEPTCGTYDACAFRLQAFQNIGAEDPIEYAERPGYTSEEKPAPTRWYFGNNSQNLG
ncbi:hypothetical protein [Halolamina salina]|uniref:PD-(D/E)XK nuclease superfamily protein n=1 Tax=Halolamina salina TaxID=1220023 RepID=A0ABD6B9X7_9EURY